MGLFNKLKNVLFEEEEIEIPVEETPVKKPKKSEPIIDKSVERKRNVYEEEIKDEAPIVSDKDLFGSEKTFDFPVFDDQEFESLKTIKREVKEEPKKSMGINLFDYERPKVKREPIKDKAPEIRGRAYDTKKNDNQKFHPSPVISPVYGVLDKNYKKEDIVVANVEKKKIDVDDVRKRAFGTLEEDIEKNLLEKPRKAEPPIEERKEIFQKEEKSIDELLEETAFDKIELPEDTVDEIENDSLELNILDEKKEKTTEEKINDNDTLENDLFDLIDSMYEDREDE